MAKKRKQVRMMVTVSVPAGMTAANARLEVRTWIGDLCGYFSEIDESDVKVRSVKGVRP